MLNIRNFMNRPSVLILSLLFCGIFLMVNHGLSAPTLPLEPDESARIDEIYDHESRLFLSLYSLQGNGEVDYVTGRTVENHMRSEYGNPVYYIPENPIFIWWNHTLWNDPLLDGINGNELVYKENTDFDASRFKPCLFNGQPC